MLPKFNVTEIWCHRGPVNARGSNMVPTSHGNSASLYKSDKDFIGYNSVVLISCSGQTLSRDLCLFRTEFSNNTFTEQTFTFKTERQTKSSAHVTVQKGWRVGADLKLRLSVPVSARGDDATTALVDGIGEYSHHISLYVVYHGNYRAPCVHVLSAVTFVVDLIGLTMIINVRRAVWLFYNLTNYVFQVRFNCMKFNSFMVT